MQILKLYIKAPWRYGCCYKYLTCFLTWSKPRFNIAIHIFEYVRRSVFMNKVFKVIWSEARNAYVVVSEMAKNHGTKSCSTKKLLAMLIATGVMTCASVAPVMAKNLTDTKTAPKMIGYEQQWNTDTSKGLLETSINAYQS